MKASWAYCSGLPTWHPPIKRLTEHFEGYTEEQIERVHMLIGLSGQGLNRLPAAEALQAQMHSPMKHGELRMELFARALQAFGVEGMKAERFDEWATWVNVGAQDAATIVRWRSRYYLTTWSDFFEHHPPVQFG